VDTNSEGRDEKLEHIFLQKIVLIWTNEQRGRLKGGNGTETALLAGAWTEITAIDQLPHKKSEKWYVASDCNPTSLSVCHPKKRIIAMTFQ